MIAGIVAVLIALYIGYILIVKGWLWAILLFVFGTIGGAIVFAKLFPASQQIAFQVGKYGISYGVGAAFLIVLFGVAFFAHHDE